MLIISAGQVIGQFGAQYFAEWLGRRYAIFVIMLVLLIVRQESPLIETARLTCRPSSLKPPRQSAVGVFGLLGRSSAVQASEPFKPHFQL